jgi:pepF/M3 family oligoendopeptidase
MGEQDARWDLNSIYPGIETKDFQDDWEKLVSQQEVLGQFFAERSGQNGKVENASDLPQQVETLITGLNDALLLGNSLDAYLNLLVAADSFDQAARRKLSEFDPIFTRLRNDIRRFQRYVGEIAGALPQILESNPVARVHAFQLQEAADRSRYLMSPVEEDLAAELSTSGGNAWRKLQNTMTSQATVEFELEGEVQNLPIPALINLHSHPDEEVRRRAYFAELKIWEELGEPLAAALNGVKGSYGVLARRRGYPDALHSALEICRIDQETLNALLDAMRGSFPMFRRYLGAKASRLGKTKLPWWDLFVPLGEINKSYTITEAREFILEHFARFSKELHDFARQAFDQQWIDVFPRKGKRGGAFCMSINKVKESRVLCNFDGSLDEVFTIAHELGHGFHNRCIFRAGKTELQRIYPMTLAETASIFCETIIQDAILAQVRDPGEELSILETTLIGNTQVIVDVYSRYLFEKEVFERRAHAELSPEELCEIMREAQLATYGDALDERYLHPYMWTWKPHYYFDHLSFYNFPYAFGLLFGTGLYALYRQRGAAFIPEYVDLLASTGEATPAQLASRFEIDIHQPDFWQRSLNVIGERIDRYLNLVA